MEACRSPKQSTYQISGPVCLLFLGILIAACFGLLGCANATVVKLAELCHSNDGKPNVSFTGETGKVDCR